MSDEAPSSYRSAVEICNEELERLLREPACREVPDGARAQTTGCDDAFGSDVLGLEVCDCGSRHRLVHAAPLEVVEHEQVPGAAGSQRSGSDLGEPPVVDEACTGGRLNGVIALLRPDAVALESCRKGCARVLTARHGVDRNVARTVPPERPTEAAGALAVELAA
jgi:hypothetical protein